MDDIRLFETDGEYLVLEAQDGQKFRLLVDDSVRSSVKKEPLARLDSIQITPREIQEEIRNGASIQDLIDRSGASFEFIEKFAAPVIAELEHIVSSALSVRLTIAGDRYNDSTQIEFGEIIAGRLITSGAKGISWVAKKVEPNSWKITANYQLNGVAGSATWSFDPRRLTLSPESETAVTLSSQETLSTGLIPKLRTVEQTANSASQPAEPVAETVVMEDVISISSRLETPIAQEEVPIPSTPAAFKRTDTPAAISTEEPLSATADLLEALRRKRTEREDTVREDTSRENTRLEPHPQTANIRVIDFEPQVTTETPAVSETAAPSNEQTRAEPETADVVPNENETKPAKKGRAAMPSWDEIVFGTKTDD